MGGGAFVKMWKMGVFFVKKVENVGVFCKKWKMGVFFVKKSGKWVFW